MAGRGSTTWTSYSRTRRSSVASCSSAVRGGLRLADVRGVEEWKSRVPPEADLVCYWFVKAGEQVASGSTTRVGFVATNSMGGGANRRALQARDRRTPEFRRMVG